MSLLSQFSNGAGSLKSASTTIAIAAAAAPSAGQVLRAISSTAAAWQAVPSGLVLLATVTPTAAVNVDFLNTFSSTYDNYLILGDGITFAADEGLNVQVAVAGAAVTSGHFYGASSSTTDATSFQLPSGADIRSAGRGANFAMTVCNVNDATRVKSFSWTIEHQSQTTPETYSFAQTQGVYKGASVVTGLRFRSTFGGNFAATGKIRVYGYANT